MPTIAGISDPEYISTQYTSALNLNTRLGLHERFSINPYGWHRWVFDQLHLPDQCSILELGCGGGHLWSTNLDRMQPGWKICLSDLSEGMLAQAQANLGQAAARFEFRTIDVQAIPFANSSIDVVIANHMLFHVPDLEKALGEINRVLKSQGRLYASTVGGRHLLDLCQLLARFSPILAGWGVGTANSFSLEEGAARLAALFTDIRMERYVDALDVTEIQPLIDYVCSGRVKFTAPERSRFVRFMKQEFKKQGGVIRITKDSGLFIAAVRKEGHAQ